MKNFFTYPAPIISNLITTILVLIFVIFVFIKNHNVYFDFLLSSSFAFYKKRFFIPFLIFYMSLFLNYLLTKELISLIFLIVTIYIIGFTYLYKKLFEKINREKSLYSYGLLFIFSLISFSYIIGFFTLVKGIPEGIYIENLSILSQYRYLLLWLLTIIIAFVYLIIYLRKKAILNIQLPSLKEEIRLILYYWNDTIFGNLCSILIKKLYSEKKLYKIIYFFFHFILFYFIRLLIATLFINFVFFNGDLRMILYFLPLSFVTWILSFFDYYFFTFFSGSLEYLKVILHVEVLDGPSYQKKNILFCQEDNFSFSLTPFAKEKGFNDSSLLAKEWFKFTRLKVDFSFYKKFTDVFSIIIFLCQFICWSAIGSAVLFSFFESFIFAEGGSFLRNILIRSNLLPARKPIEGFFFHLMLNQDNNGI